VIELTGSDSQPLWGRFAPRDFDSDHWVADVTKARAIFGWSPAVSFDDGLRRTIDWHRAVRAATADL